MFEAFADPTIDKRVDDKAGTAGDFFDDAVEMAFGPYHRPEMLDGFDAFEACEASLGDRFQGFAGRITDEMKVELVAISDHGCAFARRRKESGAKLGISIG